MTTTTNESNNAPVVVSSVADFKKWVDKHGGQNTLFRGLANAKWGVESSLCRRLKYNEVKDIPHIVFMEMVRILISRSRRNGYHIENGRELEDLALLANLQHNGAATCLIDFTENPLVALYFACASIDRKDDNGKVFAFNSRNAKLYAEISMEDFGKKIEYWFKEYEQNKKLWVLSPQKLSNRITAQKSVFVFGSPTIPTENFDTCEIKNKKEIMEELKTFGISEETLFDDFAGFSIQNAANKKYESWDTDSHFMSGILYHLSGNYESAIECYDNEIISNPELSEAYYNRGLAKSNLGKFEDAISDIDEAIGLGLESQDAYYNRGNFKSELGKLQDAISDFDHALNLNPNNSEIYYNRGNAKSKLGKSQDAINDFDMAIKLNSKNAAAYNNRGNAKKDLKKFQEAISDFDESIILNSEDAAAYSNRGNAKCHLRKYQEAISDIDKAIKLNPLQAEAYYSLGIANLGLKKIEVAKVNFAKAKELNPEFDAEAILSAALNK